MTISLKYIIGSAIYDTLKLLLKDATYCNSIDNYKFELGLQNSDDTEIDLSSNPQVYPFFYNGSIDEIIGIYNNSTYLGEEYFYQNRYIGIWNIVPSKIEKIGNETIFDVELMFIAPVLKEWDSTQRELFLFEPILDKIKEQFLYCISKNQYVKVSNTGLDYQEERGYNIQSELYNELGDYVSALKLSFKLRVLTTECEKHYEKIKNNYSKLISLIKI